MFEQTHQTRLRLQNKYGFIAVRVAPELTWEQQQEKLGGHLYERGQEGISRCCYLRKVQPLGVHLKNTEKTAWVTGLRRSHGNRAGAARLLGINVKTLNNKIKRYGITI